MKRGILTKIANDVGVRLPHLLAVLKCKRRPSPEMAQKYEAATGIPAADWIFKRESLREQLAERFPAKEKAA